MKKITAAVLSIAVAFQICTAIDISAQSAILYEASTGGILYEKEINTKRNIASTTKIMTAVVTIENVKLSDVVTVKKSCVGAEGTSMYLKPGEKLTVEELLYGLMLQSGNDAAVTLADYVGGSVSGFVTMMNKKARELKLSNTAFANPNGLTAEGHYSTAYDMAKLTAYAMSIPDFKRIVSSKSHTGGGRYLKNHNRLLRMREEIDGVKTGFTKAAGRCLVSSAVRDEMRLIAVTLKAPNDWDDHLNLYDFGFSEFRKMVYLKKGESVGEIPVAGTGLMIGTVPVNDLVWVAKQEDIDQAALEIHLPRFIYAPIVQGDKIGEARIMLDGKAVIKTALIAQENVAYQEVPGLWDKIKSWFKGIAF